MLLTIIIIIVLIWAAVVGNIYSNYIVFYNNFSETDSYNKAYYASIAALERAELVIKQRSPWYVGSWWWEYWENQWISNSDKIPDNFSYITNSPQPTTMFRTIDSRTTRIPIEWWWDVDRMLSVDSSRDYNMMDYETSETFLMYYDNSSGNPYKSGKIIQSKTPKAIWVIRLPNYLHPIFWDLNTRAWIMPNITNDAIVDRQVRWEKNWYPFTIYANQHIVNWRIVDDKDTAIRESNINNTLNFVFWYNQDPVHGNNSARKWTIISPYWPIDENTFSEIFSSDGITQKQIRFSLLNLLKNRTWSIYPFLEYYIDFWGDVSNKHYTIIAEWWYNDYLVETIIQKPTIKESILWSFTTIF